MQELEENMDGRDVRQVKRLMKIGLVERIFLCCRASQFEGTCICIKFGIHAHVMDIFRIYGRLLLYKIVLLINWFSSSTKLSFVSLLVDVSIPFFSSSIS